MGFLIAMVMRTYCIPSISSVLAIPYRHFVWMLNQVERLEAQQDLRTLRLLVAATSSDGIETATQELNKRVGTIYEYGQLLPQRLEVTDENGLDPEFDRAALRALKAKHGV